MLMWLDWRTNLHLASEHKHVLIDSHQFALGQRYAFLA